jgi:predicted NAD/FAD-dependent oxidoreductase
MRICVVGAGIAGLSAAHALVGRGHNVKVFERARVAGGRVATRILEAIELPRGLSGEVAFDHGAQYFTVRDQRFSERAAEWERDRVIAKWTGRIVSFDGEGWEDVGESTRRYVGTTRNECDCHCSGRRSRYRLGTNIESLAPLLNDFDRVIVACRDQRRMSD